MVVAALIVVIARQEQFFAAESPPVARLEERRGTVQVRAEAAIRWRDTIEQQSLFDGDRVATAPFGRATVRFDAKRALMLGENTLVRLTAIRQATGEYALLVALGRGSIVGTIGADCPKCLPMIVRAGSESYQVSMGKKIGIMKPMGKPAKKFDPEKLSNWATALRASPTVSAAAPAEAAIPAPVK